MEHIQALVDGLMQHDDKKAYHCLNQPEHESYQLAAGYPYFDVFANMLDKYLKHITADKPITA